MKHFRLHIVLALIWLQLMSCNDSFHSSIPDYPVQLNLNLTTNYPTFKNSYNKYLVFKQSTLATDFIGFGGILAYTGFDGNYYSFDLCCPYEVKQNTRVQPNDKGQAICDSCKTVYDISYGIGNPISGPAKETLRRYKANLSGDILYISR